MTGIRVYTLLTPGQKAELTALAAKLDRSVSYLIGRAIKDHIGGRARYSSAEATKKVFTRTDKETADRVKAVAAANSVHEWEVVNAAVETYLEAQN
ncbi:hypothetical protein EVC03_019 [Rhizobium phage RHph_Y5A]|nr:hypothetical protein EVC03_019 [Rhizobium phage RHph_Y5A]QIG75461.1 hypothetical protein EVC18_019 [Rhizobium phage RHph_Y2_4]